MKSLILSALLITLATTAQAQYPPRDYPLRMEPDRGPWSVPHYPSYRSDNPLEDTWLPYRVPVRYAVVIRQEIMPTPNAPTKTPEIKPAAGSAQAGVTSRPTAPVAGLPSPQIKSAASIRVDRSRELVSRSAATCSTSFDSGRSSGLVVERYAAEAGPASMVHTVGRHQSSGPYPARIETMRVSVGSAGWGVLRKLVIKIRVR